MKRAGGDVPMRKLSRTFSVVALLVSTVVVLVLNESGSARSSDYAVRIRYPGNEASAQEMKTAHKDAKAIRQEARLALGL